MNSNIIAVVSLDPASPSPTYGLISSDSLLTKELIFNKIGSLLQLFRTSLLMDKFARNRSIVKLCQTGQLTQEQIAPSFEIRQGRVSQLYHQFQVAGEAGLMVKPTPGAPPKLTQEQCAQLPDLFARGAEYYGFEGEVWTSMTSI